METETEIVKTKKKTKTKGEEYLFKQSSMRKLFKKHDLRLRQSAIMVLNKNFEAETIQIIEKSKELMNFSQRQLIGVKEINFILSKKE